MSCSLSTNDGRCTSNHPAMEFCGCVRLFMERFCAIRTKANELLLSGVCRRGRRLWSNSAHVCPLRVEGYLLALITIIDAAHLKCVVAHIYHGRGCCCCETSEPECHLIDNILVDYHILNVLNVWWTIFKWFSWLKKQVDLTVGFEKIGSCFKYNSYS